MINVVKENTGYYFPIDKVPASNEFILELYSELSLSTITFEDLSGEVQDDYVSIVISSEMCEQVSNGEYNYTLYDNTDGEKVSIGLIRFDLEESGDTEYEVYEDFFDGFVQAIELEATGFTENGTYKVGEHQNGWNEVTVNVPLESTGFTENGTYVKADGGWNEVEVNIDTDFYVQSGYTSGYTDGYSSGYTDGFVDGEENKMNWFYFQSREDGSKVRFRVAPNPLWSVSLEYSTDRINWVEWDFSAITIDSGDTVYFRGNNPDGFNDKPAQGARWYFETPSGRFNIGGDIRSLIDKTINVTTPPTWGFGYLFRNTNIVEADKKLLSGFSLLNGGCFFHLFEKCKYLTQAPDLPWKTLEGECFNGMFNGCTSLTTAPYIGATVLRGYKPFISMFNGCSSLSYVKCLISNPQEVHFSNWLRNVSPTGTFVRDYNATWSTGINGIPSGWTVKSEVELISTAITSNGTFTAETGQAFTAVTVDVNLYETREITANGSSFDVSNYRYANVAVLNKPNWISPYRKYIFDFLNETLYPNGKYAVLAFYVENVPVNSSQLTIGLKKTTESIANNTKIHWGDGTTDDLSYTSTNIGHRYSGETSYNTFSGWIYFENGSSTDNKGTVEITDWGNLMTYCKCVWVNTEVHRDMDGTVDLDNTQIWKYVYPTTIPSNQCYLYIKYGDSGNTHDLNFISRLGNIDSAFLAPMYTYNIN